jgi:hypothetical protein
VCHNARGPNRSYTKVPAIGATMNARATANGSPRGRHFLEQQSPREAGDRIADE